MTVRGGEATRRARRSQLAPPAKPFFLGVRHDDDAAAAAPARHTQRRPASDPTPPPGPARGTRAPSAPSTAHAAETDARRFASWKRASAAYSIASGYGYPHTSRHIDLLEAQSGIRPCDFKSRVLAAGTRDYGEDVAERNLGQNAADLTIPAVRSYYASLAGPPSALRPCRDIASPAIHKPLRSVVALSAFAQPEDYATGRRRHKQRNSMFADTPDGRKARARQLWCSRTGSLDPTSLGPRPNSISGCPVPERERRGRTGSGGSPSRRSRPGTSLGFADGCRVSQNRDWGTDGSLFAERTRPRSRSASPPRVPRYRMGEKQPSPPSRAPKTRRGRRSRSAQDKDTAARAYTPCPDRASGNIPSHHVFFDAAWADRRASHAPPPWPHSSSEESMDDWAPAPRSSCPPASDMTASLLTDRLAAGASSCRVPTRARHGPHVQWQSPWSPDHRDALRSRRASASNSRDASCQSRTSAQALTMDYAGHVPDRKSSLKHWSFASITPTTELSDHSSILAVRPRSIHTADTSIDLPPLADPANLSEVKESPSSSSSNGVLASSSFLTALENVESSTTVATLPDAPDALDEEHPAEEQGNSVGATGEGNDTAPESSDVDSFAEQLRRRQRLEDESTLFKRGGYVDLGSDLPGLFETAARSPCLMCSLLEIAAIGSAPEDDKTETRAPKAPCKHKGLNTRRERLRALGYEYDTEESESGPERVTRGRTRNQTERTPIGRHQRESWETIEEEPEEELGSQKVVPKLRREPRDLSKDMERLGRNRDFAAVPEDSEEGHAADVE